MDNRRSDRIKFSAYSELVIIHNCSKSSTEHILNAKHLKGHVINSSHNGVLFKTDNGKGYNVKNGDIATLYIDPELQNGKIYTFLVKIIWNKVSEFGLDFIGGDLDDAMEFKKLINYTGELLREESRL